MNKILIFVLGVFVGWTFTHFHAKNAPPESLAETHSEEAIPLVQAPPQQSLPTQIQNKSPQPTPASVPQMPAVDPPRPIDLDVSEENLEIMEQNIVELQKDVSVEKDREGWVVHFHSPDNLLAHLGVSDNDLIRFHQFDEMKLNPDTQDLAVRMEMVLANLER